MINRSTVVGVFDDRDKAERAVDELRRLGFTDEQIGFAARDGQAEGTRQVGEGADAKGGEGADAKGGEGAATGAISGGVIGGLIGAAISGLIPGIGPIIAGGILASVLGGAAVGAAAGGLFGALVGEGVPEDEAKYYDEEFRGGRTIVTVRASDRYDEAQNVLRRFGAYDIHSRDRGTETGTSVGGDYSRSTTETTTETTSVATTGSTAGRNSMSTSGSGMSGSGTTGSDWTTVGPRYQRDWQQRYGNSGGQWTDYEPYYRYSHEMSRDPRYQGRSWNEVESDLRGGYSNWAGRSGYRQDDSTWESIKDSLRDAWDSLRGHGEDASNLTARGRDRETTTRDTTTRDRDTDRMELREERLDVNKRNVEAGEARVRKEVVEERKEIDVPVRHEEAYIERHPVSDARPARGDIGEGEIRVPLREEQVEVNKETVVREEIELGKRTVQDTQRVSDTVRREEARLETEGDVKVRGEGLSGTTGRQTSQHRHVFDENGKCLTCGKSRDQLAA